MADALVDLHALSAETGVSIRLAQVKEKFGQLRLYLKIDEVSAGSLKVVKDVPGRMRLQSSAVPGSVRARAAAIVAEAEARCDGVCVLCGVPTSDTRRMYWMCSSHPET